jgi:hypothetical protein
VTAVPRTKASPKRVLDGASLPDYLTQYLMMRDAADEMSKRVNEMKATLMSYLAEEGIENEKGHKVIVVDGIATMIRERRISEAFLEDVAERWLKRKGKRDEIIKPVTVEEFDYDAFMALLFEDKTPQATVDTFYDRSENFAFKVTGRVS